MARENKRGRFGVGSRHGDSSVEPTGTDETPLDIAAVRHDDELIDAISSDGPVATDSAEEYQLATLLAGWRSDLITPELPEIDLDAIVAAVNQEVGARNARARSGGRLRLVRPVVGAAAAIAIVVGVTTAFSYNAEPGDPLWKVKEVVFSDQADSTVANIDTSSDLQDAQQLISDGKPEEAQVLLDRAATRAQDVNDDSQREDLLTTLQRLVDEAHKYIPAVPNVPLPTQVSTQVATSPSEQTSSATESSTSTSQTTEPSSAVTTEPSVPVTTEPTVPTSPEPTTPVETTQPTVETTVPATEAPTEAPSSPVVVVPETTSPTS